MLKGAALAIGSGILVLLMLGALGGGARYLQARYFYRPIEPEHLEEKHRYLDSIRPGDPSELPNFVIILFDDLGWGDLSSYGNAMIETPAMDRVARAGMRMTDFYSAAPVCTPSRAALLTGRYPVRSHTQNHVFFSESSPLATIRKMLGAGNEIPVDEIMIPEVLERAGYVTGMIGKWHLGGIPGHLPNDFGFSDFFGVLWSNDMQPLHIYRNDSIEVRDETPMQWAASFRDEDSGVEMKGVDQRRLTRRYTEEAVAFIEANRERPFLLYFAHTFPHVPHFSDPEYEGRSRAGLYGDVVEDLDRSVAAVMEALDRAGLAEKTLVVITSDNGPDYNGSPGGLRGRKGEILEGGQRVPMIVRWPGRIEPGGVSNALAMNTDLFPTLLSLAGLPLPDDRLIDGRDISGVFERGAESPHERLYYFSTVGGRPVGVRDREFKYLRSISGDHGRSKPHLSLLGADAENHDLRRLHPERAQELLDAVAEFEEQVAENPRGWL